MFPWLEADHGILSYSRFRLFNMIAISLVVKYRYNLSVLRYRHICNGNDISIADHNFSVCLSLCVCVCRSLSFLFYLSHFLLFVVHVLSLSIRLLFTHSIKNHNFEAGAGFSLSHISFQNSELRTQFWVLSFNSFVDTSDLLVINALINRACSPSQYSTILMHYNDVIMSAMASQNTSFPIVWSTVCSGANQRRHQSSASLSGLPKKGE